MYVAATAHSTMHTDTEGLYGILRAEVQLWRPWQVEWHLSASVWPTIST